MGGEKKYDNSDKVLRLFFVSDLNVTFSEGRGYPRQASDWRTENINDFGLIGPEDFLEETITEIRNDLFYNLIFTIVFSTIIIGTFLTVIIMMYIFSLMMF